MYKRLPILMLIVLCSACTKTSTKSACGTQVCTALFTYITVGFFDKNNNPVTLSKFEEVDLRTNKTMTHQYPPAIDFAAGYSIIADDSDLKNLTADGDSIQVTATDQATGQTKVTLFKIAGGACNCHVTKVSGPDKIIFD